MSSGPLVLDWDEPFGGSFLRKVISSSLRNPRFVEQHRDPLPFHVNICSSSEVLVRLHGCSLCNISRRYILCLQTWSAGSWKLSPVFRNDTWAMVLTYIVDVLAGTEHRKSLILCIFIGCRLVGFVVAFLCVCSDPIVFIIGNGWKPHIPVGKRQIFAV